MTADGQSGDQSEISLVDIEVLRGHPSPEELAAVIAVITSMTSQDDQGLVGGNGLSAWDHSQRMLRSPLSPGPGAWRGFAG